MTTKIFCLGNELAADDGIGIRVGRVLAELTLPEGVDLELRRTIGFELVDGLELATELLLVDAACTGEEVGSCRVIEIDELSALSSTPYCCHGFGLPELLSAVATVRPEVLPQRVRVLAIEVAVTDRCTTALTPAVQEGLPEAVAQVLTLVGAGPELCAEGRRRAEQVTDWQPGPTEVIG